MPDTTYLQIEEADTDALRVVELPGAAIRVGRGSLCEVRLCDPDLAEVQCLLRRRGTTWHVQPIGPAGLVSLGGQSVDQLRPLPPDEPLRVGSFRLLLRHEGGDGFHAPIEIGNSTEIGPQAPSDHAAGRSSPSSGRGDIDGDRLRRWQARAELRERWVRTRQEEKRWEARWRAAGEGLRARGGSSAGHRLADEPPHSDAGFASGPVRRAPIPQEAAPTNRIVPPRAEELRKAHRRPLPVPDAPTTTSSTDPAATPSAPEPPAERVLGSDNPVWSDSRGLRVPPKQNETSSPPELIAPRSDPSTAVEESAETAAPESAQLVDRDTSTTSLQHHLFEEPGPFTPPQSGPAEGSAHTSLAPTALAGRSGVEFRGAAAILAAQGSRVVIEPISKPKAHRRTATYGFPTEPIAPAQWSIPAWLALPSAGVAALTALGAGLILAAAWTVDNSAAGLAARAALRTDDARVVQLDPAERVETRWWRTSPGHLALWSAALERSPDSATRVDEVRDALDAARRSAPLESSTRFASAQAIAGWAAPSSVAALGLSRDVATLTFTGRTLKRSGKSEPALRAYRMALELAAASDHSRLAAPAFDDDPQVRRYRLPHEAIVAAVIRDMIEVGDWSFPTWSPALPPRAVVRLAAARLLREKGDADAERALGLVLADDLPILASAPLAAEELAARAEALALTERRREAAERYREAIASVPYDAIRRRWRLALAEILTPLGESSERAELLEAAKASDPTDDVTRKAVEAQHFSGLK